ncbi:MAG: restriction endonuclease [Syntrophaceae bacterium CG2_30_49_12]|nr:MAG: restriction endonuclease [Syntrophaceae bacterium CG2_30_49_12]PIP06106.1 MAG: restriction endonuclease [Syntrophobacterales bacterium CG23_combo_of_CG06-09_8_20_14_all_48_27]PJA49666.1 MAG: ScaI family restriction endonuclease [Syntrophobacterales bacterium CG_4_9_14_3_um_filter_49_8]
MPSPYRGLKPNRWLEITKKLLDNHPLAQDEIVDVVLSVWKSIFDSKMGTKGFRIGKDIFPKPQIMGFFLHELIPLELAARYPNKWRGEKNTSDKDIVYIPDDRYSIEVKTSSDPNHIYGNRSYAQATPSKGKKAKSGYYLAVNFEKFSKTIKYPHIRLIRFGWLDSEDWMGQKAPTGQQSRLPTEVENNKLLELYRKP